MFCNPGAPALPVLSALASHEGDGHDLISDIISHLTSIPECRIKKLARIDALLFFVRGSCNAMEHQHEGAEKETRFVDEAAVILQPDPPRSTNSTSPSHTTPPR